MNRFKKIYNPGFLAFLLLGVLCSCSKTEVKPVSLKLAVGDRFYIGTALNSAQIDGADTSAIKIIKQHFNAVVAENVMKSEVVQPVEGEFDFDMADKFVRFGLDNKLFITGHTLIWHSQAPNWLFVDKQGNDVSRDVLIERMRSHIHTVVGRYKGIIKGWDVVNEAILDDGTWRKSKFYEIIGADFVKLAFEFAHEADPEAELYYNDYSMAKKGKREGVVAMVKSLQEQGVRIDGIGMQGHISMDDPTIEDFEKSIVAFSELGVQVMVTELDLTVLPMPNMNAGADIALNFEFKKELNPYANGLPDSINTKMTERYQDFFRLFYKHSNKISRVTLWGVSDAQSWRNYWPVNGRTDYPLLFDREYKAKPIVEKIINEDL
ncbi:endo-1,4-beta-xylanase [Labilibaculum euxinus]|uniref:Beta-xylanase n=1 Tax=Labilibaculum euxinus TaxID=2686357 RepID=A0A7M4D208_9BACT|nr:endo-1,4-beta-xylanase [Labilibaculum euxinus]MUP36687.1 1,4-beta-xylanase [Labilibaculum euxinus]MVB05892.1 1,4-beta-xylanase [Labilibaculum euxinus]